jgi:thiol-disulfide isomerase/thioredoxin
MRKLFFLFLLALPFGLIAQQSATSKAKKPATTTKPAAVSTTKPTPIASIRVICSVIEPPSPMDSLNLYEYAGYGMRKIAAAASDGKGVYTLTIPGGPLKFYGIGFNEVNTGRVVLGDEPEVKLWANAQFMDRARTLGSKQNAGLEQVIRKMSLYQMTNWNDPELYKERVSYVDSLKKAGSFFWRSANLLSPPFFQGKDVNREGEYYGMNWFSHVDFNDRVYDQYPDVYFAFAAFANRISSMTNQEDEVRLWCETQLKRIPANSEAYRLALGGILRTFQQRQMMASFARFAKEYVDKYENKDRGEMESLKFELAKAGTSTPGMAVPDLIGMTPENESFSLSALRGKIVLIDFWASWCGPCRKENPNVRAVYQKYKDQGFEILGVSLDRDAVAWKKAIADDQLPWKHISDLKGWQSSHAALYSVSSIPQTLLIDRDGKLIVRNLRGEGLKTKLAEVFGN